MIEIICKEDQEKENMAAEVQPPKNIRQVGNSRGRHKIYVEDYVYTYVRAMAHKKEKCAAVLLGKSQVSKDIRYTFISGAIECTDAVFQWENICLDDSFWEYIYSEEKEYFDQTKIVGWFIGKQGQALEITAGIEAAHRKYFPGRDKVLMLMDAMEGEELFYLYEQGYLQKREGYYIYYEKNLSMQEYMIRKKEEERNLLKPLEEEELWWSPESDGGKKNPIGVRKSSKEPKGEKNGTFMVEIKDSEWEELHREIEETVVEQAVPLKEYSKKKLHLKEESHFKEEPHFEKKSHFKEEPHFEKKSHFKEEPYLEKESHFKEGVEEVSAEEKIFVKSSLEEPKTQAEQGIETYRSMLLKKQITKTEKQSRKFLYTAASFFLVLISVMGITTMNNYHKMKEVEDALAVMASSIQDKTKEQETGKDTNQVVVEQLPSLVEPLNQGDTAAVSNAAQPDTTLDSTTATTLPPATSDPVQTIPVTPQYYTVAMGDTLGSICQKVYQNRSKVGELCQVNGIEDGDKIYPGQKLLLP